MRNNQPCTETVFLQFWNNLLSCMPGKQSDLTHCLYLVSLPTALGSVFFRALMFLLRKVNRENAQQKAFLCLSEGKCMENIRSLCWVSACWFFFFFFFFEESVEGAVFKGGERMSFLFGKACKIRGAGGSLVQMWPEITTPSLSWSRIVYHKFMRSQPSTIPCGSTYPRGYFFWFWVYL